MKKSSEIRRMQVAFFGARIQTAKLHCTCKAQTKCKKTIFKALTNNWVGTYACLNMTTLRVKVGWYMFTRCTYNFALFQCIAKIVVIYRLAQCNVTFWTAKNRITS